MTIHQTSDDIPTRSAVDNEEPRCAAATAFAVLHAAAQQMIDMLEHQQALAQELMSHVLSEPSVTRLVTAFDASRERDLLLTALAEYEANQRDSRLALWRLMLSEGCSIGRISRIYGLSCQRVSQQLLEHGS